MLFGALTNVCMNSNSKPGLNYFQSTHNNKTKIQSMPFKAFFFFDTKGVSWCYFFWEGVGGFIFFLKQKGVGVMMSQEPYKK